MILSASGWRKVFAESGNEQDTSPSIGQENKAISVFAAEVFANYIKNTSAKESPIVILGMDSRPTGKEIADAAVKSLVQNGISVKCAGIIAAPEIMAYSRNADGFMYISASHNPIGHNGIKFGLNTGGVLNAEENAKLTAQFKERCESENAVEEAISILKSAPNKKIEEIYEAMPYTKIEALAAYKKFLLWTISGTQSSEKQNELFSIIKSETKNTDSARKIGVVCDMNGSARAASVDEKFFTENGISFYAIHNTPGEIAHEIIPESENLVFLAAEMERLQKEGKTDAILGYMPDCDGDRGNIVYWDEKAGRATILKAQEVFSLSVLAELSYAKWINKQNANFKSAVAVNCPTSMRIDEIATTLGAKVFRAEVGEANVVSCAQEKRAAGYDVRIFGEGSNGGTITHPSSVRDPLNTVFAIIKLLSIKELYKNWCDLTGAFYSDDFSLTDILDTLPKYTTTGVSESRAVLHIATKDHSLLKSRFQNVFQNEWTLKKDELYEKYKILYWECVITNGTKETRRVTDFSKSGRGGLKIVFYDEENIPVAFIWMRGSGTEPVFRILCDVKGDNPEMERFLLQWETQMLTVADGQTL
ncbi:MAG: phosphoglucomutase [Treponemataceae bacterium]|nr:phosphoglucomutase [Treponemataceae bacterium]